MNKSKANTPKPEAPKTEVRGKRDAVRDKNRGKRAALRGAATAASCLLMAGLLGCATATPSSNPFRLRRKAKSSSSGRVGCFSGARTSAAL